MEEHRRAIPASERLDGSRDRQVSFRIPLALDQRLDALVQRAEDAGERTNRRELLAALLYAVDLSGDNLGDALRAYRRATVRDAVLDVDVENIVEFARHAPGPRTRHTR